MTSLENFDTNLIADQEREFYSKLKCRLHCFFLSLLSIFLMRLTFYSMLRFHNFQKMFNSIKLTDNIDPLHSYMMGVEEFLINAVLLTYLYGVNTGVSNEGGKEQQKEDDDLLRPTFIFSSDLTHSVSAQIPSLQYQEPLIPHIS
jgi:hypothetical protein